MKKTVVYGATRRIYHQVVPCVRSAVMNGNIDEVVLLIEDDVFPYQLPCEAKIINVSQQPWFNPQGPNALKRWTYMVMMKCCLTKLLPDYDRALFLDCDTLVEHDLSELFDLDMTGYWYAAVPQNDDGREGNFTQGPYYNAGVLLVNLTEVKEDELIRSLQIKDWEFNEQDCINRLCADRILALQGRWNVSDYTIEDTEVYIWHFASLPDWMTFPEAYKYLGGYDETDRR